MKVFVSSFILCDRISSAIPRSLKIKPVIQFYERTHASKLWALPKNPINHGPSVRTDKLATQPTRPHRTRPYFICPLTNKTSTRTYCLNTTLFCSGTHCKYFCSATLSCYGARFDLAIFSIFLWVKNNNSITTRL